MVAAVGPAQTLMLSQVVLGEILSLAAEPQARLTQLVELVRQAGEELEAAASATWEEAPAAPV